MSPLKVKLGDLINEIDAELGDEDQLVKISEAQRRASTLADLGDQLVGHYVSRARESGASWSQIGEAIGVSKQAAQQRWVPQHYTFERYTPRARHVIVLAQESARSHEHDHISAEHILIGLLDESDALAAKIITNLAGSTQRLQEVAESLLAQRPAGKALKGHIPFAESAQKILEESAKQAVELGHNYVGTEHLLLAFVVVAHTGRSAPVLDGLGLTVEAVRTQLREQLAAYMAKKPLLTKEVDPKQD